jgi:site-specific recombinase XerC
MLSNDELIKLGAQTKLEKLQNYSRVRINNYLNDEHNDHLDLDALIRHLSSLNEEISQLKKIADTFPF